MNDRLCSVLISAAQGWKGGEVGHVLRNHTGQFLSQVPNDVSLLSRVTAALETLEPGAAAWIAVTCGSAIERGANPALTWPRILGLLVSWLPQLPQPDSESGEFLEPTAQQAALLQLFPFVCQSAVSHLARLPEERERLWHDRGLLERLENLQDYTHGAIWLRQAIVKSSGTLIVIHPQSGRGLRVHYQNVSFCFHLFSLLQSAIGTRLPGGREPDEAIASMARGGPDVKADDHAWWHYGDAFSRKPELAGSIWGEALVREIPRVDGMPIILLWPPILGSRSWDAGFLAPHLAALPADAVVESELGSQESAAWLEKIGIK